MEKTFFSLRIVTLFSLLLIIIFQANSLSQNYWERTSGPGTVTVYDFLFKDNFILIGTWHGGIYKSTDEGENWQHMENEFSSSTVSALKLLSNGNILVGTSKGIFISSDNGETWIYSGLSDYLVSTITIDEVGSIYVGSVYGEDIYRSDDSGVSWTPLNTGLMGISSIVIQDTEIILVSSANGINRSSDRGETWNRVLSPEKLITDLAMNTNGKFSAVSERGTFYISSDEGVTWDSISTLNHTLRIIYCSPNGELYAGSYGVYRSNDEGRTWNLLNGFQGCGLVRSIKESGNSFYAGASFSGVFRSTDSANNWFQSSKGINHSTITIVEKDLTDRVYAVSALAGFSVTSDNGENWEILSMMPPFNSFSISPNGGLFGSMGGDIGIIFRSVNGGYDWEIVYEGTDYTFISSVVVSPNETVFAFMNGKLLRTVDNGSNWDTLQISSPYESLKKININSQGIIFTKSSEGYFRSSDNGESWIPLTSIHQGLEIFGITKSDDMYATASDSGFYRSTDYGNSWTYLSKGSGKSIRSFASNDIGYIFILEHFHNILRSTDNGISWQEINSGLDSASINCLIITDDDYLLAGTGWGGVYRSVNKTTSVENLFTAIPNSFLLEQNYPNPFNPTTNIRFYISDFGFVSLKIFDVLGNEIKTLLSEEKPAGYYDVHFDGSGIASGIYFYQIKAGEFNETRKMILLK